MEIILIGYGQMGRAVCDAAHKRGHKVTHKFNTQNSYSNSFTPNAVGIDFTNAQAFRHNYRLLADNCKAAVVGTTGWEEIQQEVFDYFAWQKKTLIYAHNFSLGANIYLKVVEIAAKLLSGFDGYDPYILEMHHHKKKDRPSAEAKNLASILQNNFQKEVEPTVIRSGWCKGIHEVGYESMLDKITLRHEAYLCDGFARGAIMAAEWTENLRGIHNFQDLLNTKFQELLT